jgi:hypothetical protein
MDSRINSLKRRKGKLPDSFENLRYLMLENGEPGVEPCICYESRGDRCAGAMGAPRSFPPPWNVIEIQGGFRVQDANGRALSYVYFYPGSDSREDECLTYIEALGVADQIARPADSTAGLADRDQNPAVVE